MRTNDGEWVRRAASGDHCAFAKLVDRYRGMTYGAAYHYLGSAEDAQDIAQEAFVQAHGRLNQLREPEKFAPWLRRLTQNLCAAHLRRRGLSLALGDDDLAAPGLHAGETLESLTTRLLVREALGRLSEKTRLTVTLCYLGGYSHSEIAHFLDIPLATVRSRLQHAKRQLRQEMQVMVSDTLNQGRPDEQWTRQVVEEALRRGAEALQNYERGEAVRHYDAALTAIERMGSGAERQRLRLEALRRKEDAVRYSGSREETIALLEQALAVAQGIGDRPAQAEIEQSLGGAYSRLGEPERTAEHYHTALSIYRELGDALGQGNCLLFLGMHLLSRNEVAAARPCFEQAMSLFAQADSQDWLAVCGAMRGLLDVRGGADFDTLLLWAAVCDTLEQKDGRTRFVSQPGFMVTRRPDDAPAALFISSVFWQVSHLRLFLDAGAPVGGSWSGRAFSYSDQPVQATVTVLGDAARVTTPAGTFDRCLLTEQVTAQTGEASDRRQPLNLSANCGTARAWYAPGVGLVQLHVCHDDGSEATVQLQDYAVAEANTNSLPLAVGNRWEYGWADLPAEYDAREVYQVSARQGDLWYLEHYAYADRKDAA